MSLIDSQVLCDIAIMAGNEILKIYNSEKVEHQLKADHSPLTQADLASNQVICEQLKTFYPDIPILSEESTVLAYEERQKWKSCFIVDPLDGTKEFLKKNGEFTVNIAYVVEGKVQEGVVFAPALDSLYFTREGKSFKRVGGLEKQISVSLEDSQELRVVCSRSHIDEKTNEFIEKLKDDFKEVIPVAVGSSLKFCLVAEGKADVYPRFGPMMEWDTAAAQVILEQANGRVVNADSRLPLEYNKESLYNPSFVASRNLGANIT